MKGVTVIIPIGKNFTAETDKALLEKAVASVEKGTNVVYVGAEDKLPETLETNEKNIVNTGETDFCSQINLAVSKIRTKYFSILEYDDEYTSIWFKNVEDYIKNKPDDTSVYLPLTEVYDYQRPESGAIGYANDAVWAASFSEEIGCIDLACLDYYTTFSLTGSVFKTDDFKEIGGLKPSITFAFWYEFLMRAAYNGKRLYTIPKIGYHHFVNRKGSLSDTYATTMTAEEGDKWLDIAKKEYFFKTARNIKEIYD